MGNTECTWYCEKMYRITVDCLVLLGMGTRWRFLVGVEEVLLMFPEGADVEREELIELWRARHC